MPIWFAVPILLKGAAMLAGTVGVGAAVKGAVDVKNANDTMKAAKNRHEDNLDSLQRNSDNTMTTMEELGKLEADVAEDFKRFSNAFEQIQKRPDFSARKFSAEITKFDFDQIKASSVAATALLGAITGTVTSAAFGTAAAAGLKLAVITLGKASTGAAISGLVGVAKVKATMALLGGGTLAAGGGGVVAGTAALGAATLGAGLLVGGVIFASTSSKLKEKAGETYYAMLENEQEIKKSIKYLVQLHGAADRLASAINRTHKIYDTNVKKLILLVEREKDWKAYSEDEQLLVENTIRIVSVLHKMINTPLLKVTRTDEEGNPTRTAVDDDVVNSVIALSTSVLA